MSTEIQQVGSGQSGAATPTQSHKKPGAAFLTLLPAASVSFLWWERFFGVALKCTADEVGGEPFVIIA